jgi:hypothetical protein
MSIANSVNLLVPTTMIFEVSPFTIASVTVLLKLLFCDLDLFFIDFSGRLELGEHLGISKIFLVFKVTITTTIAATIISVVVPVVTASSVASIVAVLIELFLRDFNILSSGLRDLLNFLFKELCIT